MINNRLERSNQLSNEIPPAVCFSLIVFLLTIWQLIILVPLANSQCLIDASSSTCNPHYVNSAPRISNTQTTSLINQPSSQDASTLAYQEGRELWDKRKKEDAIKRFREALRFRSEYPEALNSLGAALLDRGDNGDYKEAAEILRKAILLKPDSFKAHYNLGRTLEKLGNLEEALKEYKETVKLNPNFAKAHYDLGHVQRTLGNHPGAIAEFREAIRLDESKFWYHNDLGNELVDAGHLDEAIAAYEKANKLEEQDPDIKYNLGTALMKARAFEEAKVYLKRAIEIKPEFAQPHFHLGLVYLEQSLPAFALREFELARQYGLEGPFHSLATGAAYAMQRDMDSAIIHYQAALKSNPDLFEGHYNLALAYREKGKIPQAIKELQIAKQINSKDPYTANELGVLLLSINDLSGAIEEFQRAIRLMPKFPEAYNNLGAAFLKQEKALQARDSLSMAVQLGPGLSKAHYNFARSLVQTNDQASAIKSYTTALRLKRDYPEARNELGKTLVNVGLKNRDESKIEEGIREIDTAFLAKMNNWDEVIKLGDMTAKEGYTSQGDKLRATGRLLRKAEDRGVVEPMLVAYKNAVSNLEMKNEPKSQPTSDNKKPREESKYLIQAAYWNVWFQKNGETLSEPVTQINGGEAISLILNLAPFKFNQPGVNWVGADETLKEELRVLRGTKPIINVRTVLGGRGLEFIKENDGKLAAFVLDNLDRLEEPFPPAQGPKETFANYASRVEVGHFALRLKSTEEGGCAVVGLSIWNETRNKAFDHITRHVWVEPKVKSKEVIPDAEECASRNIVSQKTRTGLITLLTRVPVTPPDAALHSFKMGTLETAVIYLEDKQGNDFGWTVKDDVVQYLTQDEKFLEAIAKGRNGDYSDAGHYIATELFGIKTGKCADENQRCKARVALINLAERSSPPDKKTLFSRLVDQAGNILFLPIGMMKVDNGFLADHISVIQPLLRETFTNTKKMCIRPSNWVLAIPDNLHRMEEITEEVSEEISEENTEECAEESTEKNTTFSPKKPFADWYGEHLQEMDKVMGKRTKKMKDLQCYLQEACSETDDKSIKADKKSAGEALPEGFILLAHHSEGNIWFDKDSHLRFNTIGHQFVPGSVAILAACSVAKLNSGTYSFALLDELNRHNIDAAIMTPFDVNLKFGMEFAVYFTETVLSEYKRLKCKKGKKAGPTLSSLFEKTVTKMKRSIPALSNNPLYEFVLAGNEEIHICAE